MPDLRVKKLAQVLVQYSLDIQPDEDLVIYSSPLADELNLAVYKEAILAGANVLMMNRSPGTLETFLRHANDSQLEHVSAVQKLITETYTASLSIEATHNTRELAGIDPQRLARRQRALAKDRRLFDERTARGELRWCYTLFPTQAAAQEAGMSLPEFQDLVYGAGLLDHANPVEAWKEEGRRQRRLIDWLAGKDQVVIKGTDIDLRLSIKGRNFVESDGRYNFPDGEIFTGPVEQSVNGWVRFSFPAIHLGQEVNGVELWFEDGKVVKEKAAQGQELLSAQLDTDSGARYLGEWGVGTNYGIQRFSRHMLFDEKMGGTIHLALGSGYPESGSQNVSGIHWDMLCNMKESEILVDGQIVYRDGVFVI